MRGDLARSACETNRAVTNYRGQAISMFPDFSTPRRSWQKCRPGSPSGTHPRPSHDSRRLFRSARVLVSGDGSEFHRPKTYVALRRQARKLPGESRMLRGGAGEIHQFFSDRIVNGRPPPERRVALFWLGSKLDNAALWESGTGPTLKNRGPSAFSTSSISRQLFERRDGISVPMAAQAVRLPQPPPLAIFWATKLA
jgi:hypothetical protein